MSLSLSSPITGAPQAGLTSPTYTFVTDTAPSLNGVQYAITALGGTQAGVNANSVSKPFTISFFKPMQLRVLPQANPVTGVVKNVPINSYKLITRKGALPSQTANMMVARITTTIDVPAGTDSYAANEIRAMLSAHIGALSQTSSGIGDTVVTGIV